MNGLQPWTERGIAGRAVLIDYASYAEQKGLQVSHFAQHAITLQDVLAIANVQGVEFQMGDILLLRTGYVAAYKELGKEKKKEVASVKEWIGLGQGRDVTEWLWERQFAAVGSDSPGFEVRCEFLAFVEVGAGDA